LRRVPPCRRAGHTGNGAAAEPPSAENFALVPRAYETLEHLSELHGRILSRLAVLAEKDETAAGLPPGAEPKT
jgi:hypothetical protein